MSADTAWSQERIAELRRLEIYAYSRFCNLTSPASALSLLDELESAQNKLQMAGEESRACALELESVRRERDEAQATISAIVVTLLAAGYGFPIGGAV